MTSHDVTMWGHSTVHLEASRCHVTSGCTETSIAGMTTDDVMWLNSKCTYDATQQVYDATQQVYDATQQVYDATQQVYDA